MSKQTKYSVCFGVPMRRTMRQRIAGYLLAGCACAIACGAVYGLVGVAGAICAATCR